MLDRRSFLSSAGIAAASGAAFLLDGSQCEGAVQNVNRNSLPSQLKITDLRVAVVGASPINGSTPIRESRDIERCAMAPAKPMP